MDTSTAKNKIAFFMHVFCVVLVLFGFSFAEAQAKKRVMRDPGQRGRVTVDGAAVYEAPNFDSPVMDYLDRGKTILISRRVYRGAGGLGAFHKIRLRKGVFGYITDVDIQIIGALGKKGAPTQAQPAPKPQVDPTDPTQIQPELESSIAQDEANQGAGIYLTRYLMANYATYDYTEKLANKTQSADFSMFGFKLSGPGSIMGGLPLDLEMNLAMGEPDFYSQYFTSVKGFMLLGHAMLMLPGMEFKRGLLFYGGGLSAKYARYEVITRNSPNLPAIDSQDLVLGLAGQFGYAHQIGSKYLLKADFRYYFEKESYMGYAVSFGTKF